MKTKGIYITLLGEYKVIWSDIFNRFKVTIWNRFFRTIDRPIR